MFYVRLLLISLWLIVCCTLGILNAVVQWGNLDLDRRYARLFAWGATRIASIQVIWEGLEHLGTHQPCVYVSNHQSAMDMATYGSLYPSRTVVIGKREVLYIPFFGLFFVAAGNIVINRQKHLSAMVSLAGAIEKIRSRQASIWIFPEGTRNRTDELLLPFKKGAFYMALHAAVPIVPLVCTPIGKVFDWKKKRMPGGTLRIRVLPPIEIQGYEERDVERLTKEVREKILVTLRELAAQGT